MENEKTDLGLRTKNFALQIIRFFAKLPRTSEAQVLGKQLLRAATSVGANYREAFRGRSRAAGRLQQPGSHQPGSAHQSRMRHRSVSTQVIELSTLLGFLQRNVD